MAGGHPLSMDNQVEVLNRALRENGYRLTATRRAILTALVNSGGHVTADELVADVNRTSPQVGRMTVYRTLDLLQQLGLIRPVYQGTGAAHYVLMQEGHHHHLLCSMCDAVVEFDECAVQEMEEQIRDRFQFEIQGHLLEIYGLCPDCQKQTNL